MKALLFLLALPALWVNLAIAASPDLEAAIVVPQNHNSPKGLWLKAHYLYQQADYTMSSFDLQFPETTSIPPATLALLDSLGPNVITDLETTNYVTSLYLEWRLWNWLGLNLRLGELKGEAKLSLAAPFQATTLDYSGKLVGLGPTFYFAPPRRNPESWIPFVVCPIEWIHIEFDNDTGFSQTWAVRPKIGLKYDRFTIWAGATWLNGTQNRTGTFPALGNAEFESVSEDRVHWNYSLGAGYRFTDHLQLNIEYGFGQREHFGASLGYRF